MTQSKFSIDAEGYAVIGRLLLGLVGIFQVAIGGFFMAGLTMVLCVWVDAFIGLLARRHGPKTPSTVALESYADFFCFIILPMYFAFLRESGLARLALPVFLLAGVYRLARFHVEGLVKGKGYLGLPTTYNGYLFPLYGICGHFFPSYDNELLVILILVVSYLMVSTRFVTPEI